MAVEGAAAVYWNRKYYADFFYERLKAERDNILQEVLASVEMISLFRLFDIFHFTVCMPIRFIAINNYHIDAVGNY